MKRNIHASVVCALLVTALWSGLDATYTQLVLYKDWCRLGPADRDAFVLGPYAAVVGQVTSRLTADQGLLLVSGVDPALFPYALFPRKIWQLQVDPETNALYMETPSLNYPARHVESFSAEWLLTVQPDSLARGGELRQLRTRGER